MKLLKYVKEYKYSASLGFIFKIFEAALELCVPVVMASVIDKGIGHHNTNYILKCGLVLIGLALCGYLFALVCQWYASKTSQSVGTALRKDMYHQINQYDDAALDRLTAPSLVTRLINDVVQIQLAVALTIRLTSRAPFLMIGSLFMAFMISGSLSMIFVVGAIILAVSMLSITVLSMPYFARIQKLLDKIALIARENLKGVRVIRAFSNQEYETNRFHQETKNQKDEQVKVGKIQAMLNPFTYLIVNFAIIIIIYASGFQINVGTLTQGEVIALVNYMNSILQALIVFANVLSTYNKATASYERIFEVLETKSQVQDEGIYETMVLQDKMIEFDDVSFGYTNKDVLHHLNFTIKKGETVGIIGGTGAGKSTLVSLIGRNYDVTSGQIKIAGRRIQDYKLATLRKHISYVLQNTALISGTIKENLCMSLPYQEGVVNQALEVSQAKEFVSLLPQGLESPVVQGGKNFSGGQRQRLTIARALVKQGDILVLDDCSSALDYATDAALQKQLQQLKDVTKIVISQRTSSLKRCDRIMVLYHGEIVGFDSHDQLLKDCVVYKEIYESQNSKDGDYHG
ncbi:MULTISPECIES: ABC transporter ATP-binding protein [Coprobacillaceae]|uniref:ABC transporter ATP-binding protein n=1 Tax=Coprobacillaceae TaxID=2810280 RepID=UPI000E538BA0|nr:MULTISPECIES: ABC transporter ATP-binding protein [Coprobacillaceae]RHM59922.1 ABC transporter ATP-binding protein [Coprobacillus sp. AF33-1AC]RHS92260.1 ABC transporter ATP-binding protein [Erysipelatoclostridium sp. AM42-17]